MYVADRDMRRGNQEINCEWSSQSRTATWSGRDLLAREIDGQRCNCISESEKEECRKPRWTKPKCGKLEALPRPRKVIATATVYESCAWHAWCDCLTVGLLTRITTFPTDSSFKLSLRMYPVCYWSNSETYSLGTGTSTDRQGLQIWCLIGR